METYSGSSLAVFVIVSTWGCTNIFQNVQKRMMGSEGTLLNNIISDYYYRLPVFLLQLVIKQRKVEICILQRNAYYSGVA